MPFRAKVRRVLGRSGDASDGPAMKKSHTIATSTVTASDFPKPKYRGPVDPKHREHLENFSFSPVNVRRPSSQSLYSPFGSRLPSRNNSLDGGLRKFQRNASHIGKEVENSDESTNASDGSYQNDSKDILTPDGHRIIVTDADSSHSPNQSLDNLDMPHASLGENARQAGLGRHDHDTAGS